jgi:prepilin-type N-terminal cleavage/methylation domain-containing protein
MKKLHAFTLIEVLIATAIMAVVGGILFTTLWQGTILFAKNTAINVAHQQARISVIQIEKDLHSCVSVPQLIDANRLSIPGNGPAAGIAFQHFASGPFQVAPGDYRTTQRWINIITNGVKPKVGQRLNIVTHNIESYITAVSGISATNYRLTLDANLNNEVNTTLSGQVVNISSFITDQVTYIVESGQLRFYPKRGGTAFTVMTSNITSPIPFSIPTTTAGAPYNRFVAAINLSTADTGTSNRGFRAANMFLNSMVPYRSKLTETQ